VPAQALAECAGFLLPLARAGTLRQMTMPDLLEDLKRRTVSPRVRMPWPSPTAW
jgi:hypothetical protein